jgi:hypothetical protein
MYMEAKLANQAGNRNRSKTILFQLRKATPCAKTYYCKAIKCNPTYLNPYHALGTLEHTHGHIRAALTVIKEGIRNCPYNHQLNHALGDVYMDANMLDLAEGSYLAGL